VNTTMNHTIEIHEPSYYEEAHAAEPKVSWRATILIWFLLVAGLWTLVILAVMAI